MSRTNMFLPSGALLSAFVLVTGTGCPQPPSPSPVPPLETAENVGSAACRSCHPNVGALQSIHGHSQALKAIEGVAPAYPAASPVAGVPNPPAGFAFTQIDFVIGGYAKAANFVDTAGFLLTDGTAGTHAQWNLLNGPAELAAQFIAFMPGQTTPLPYSYGCFYCHTTGPESVDTNGGRRQGNRPGIGGTWSEDAVQCEACHGPGSLHVSDPPAGNIIVDSTPAACARCHVNPDDPTSTAVAARDGFIVGTQQFLELSASPMSFLSCNVCHNPHASVLFDPVNGIRNQCLVCHPGQNMALHSGKILAVGDYVERLACQSCHMPLASKNASSATFDVFGDTGRVGDTRTHIFNMSVVVGQSMLTPDGSEVATDASGQAAVTLDYVCLRCHNGRGSAFPLTLSGAGAIARGIHNPQ